MMPGPQQDLIVVRNVRKHYDGVRALDGARLAVRAGEVHALVGENGAGKSTLARIIAGVSRPDAGEILIDGLPVAIASPRDAQQHGVGIVYQELDIFPHLTVGENIVIGNLHFPEGWMASPRRIDAFCQPFLRQVGLASPASADAGTLPIGQRQLLAIARALSMNARLLILDEPTSAMSEDGADRLFAVISQLKARGVGIIYVSHRMPEIWRISDRITVLRDGTTVDTRETRATTADEIIRLMVGRPIDHRPETRRVPDGQIILSLRRVSTRKLRDVSFDLHAGEVLGVAGLVGAGRSALGAALYGIDSVQEGQLAIRGRPYVPRDPIHALRRGVGLLPEDRQLQGLMMQMTVRENSTLSVLDALSPGGLLHRRREAEATDRLYRRLGLTCASPDAPVGTLSGGNQQKVLLARILLADPDVLFLDDPTRGVDIGAKDDIRQVIEELAAGGKGIVLVSSELSELLHWCDRILVLRDGRVVGVYPARASTSEAIMTAATGHEAHVDRAR